MFSSLPSEEIPAVLASAQQVGMSSWQADVVSVVYTQYTIIFLGFSSSTSEAPRSHHRGTES
jgi:hypothetical protein